jgi:hypothetical protein
MTPPPSNINSIPDIAGSVNSGLKRKHEDTLIGTTSNTNNNKINAEEEHQ